MNVPQKTIWVIVTLLLLSFAYASDGGVVDENVTWIADAFQQPNFADIQEVNITIYYPNQTIFQANKTMVNFGNGKYRYEMLPNQTGNWYAYVEFYNTTSKIGTASQSMEIREADFMSGTEGIIAFNIFTFLIGYGIFIAIVLYILSRFNEEKAKEVIIYKIIVYGFIFFTTIMIPKSILDGWVSPNTTASVFFFAVTWLVRVVSGVLIINIIWRVLAGFEIITKTIEALRR